jgi:SSS family solute:Na+ symporter
MVDIIVVAVYLVFVLGLGLWAGGQLRSLEEYAVVGRSYGPLVIFAADEVAHLRRYAPSCGTC